MVVFKNYRFAWKILRFLPCFFLFARFVDKNAYYFCKKGNKCIIQFVLQTQLFKRICFIYSWWNSQLIFIIALVTLFDWSPFYFSCCVQFILTEKKNHSVWMIRIICSYVGYLFSLLFFTFWCGNGCERKKRIENKWNIGKMFGVPDCHLKYINTKTKQNHLFTNPIKPMRSFDEIALD